MLVLGIIICLGLLLHLYNFWYNMMFAELVGTYTQYDPADGFAWIKETFSNPVFVVLYVIWLVAIIGFGLLSIDRYFRQIGDIDLDIFLAEPPFPDDEKCAE